MKFKWCLVAQFRTTTEELDKIQIIATKKDEEDKMCEENWDKGTECSPENLKTPGDGSYLQGNNTNERN